MDYCWWMIVQARIFTLCVTIAVYFVYVWGITASYYPEINISKKLCIIFKQESN
jgi:hypothetical protein